MRRNQLRPDQYTRTTRSVVPAGKPPLRQVCRSLVAPVVVAFLLAASCGAQNAQPAGTNHLVVMKEVHFDPPQITVKPGDNVQWKNEDIFSHTVTADDGSFDSGLIDPGHSWLMTVKRDETIAYHCRPHPNMRATLLGQAANREGGSATGSVGSLKWSPPRRPEEFHPILVNFTAALLPLALLSDILGRIFHRRSLHDAAWWMVLYAAVITPFTAAAGWWWKLTESSTLPARLIAVHQWLGGTVVVLFAILAVWRWSVHKRDKSPSFAYLTFATIVVLAVVYQGSLGGRMVFGK
jgi:uncharacterized membrane protein/plastocyanin